MKVGSIFGIEISINPSWVFIFLLVAYSLSQPMGPLGAAQLSSVERVTLGIVASLLFFGSVLFHELAHSLLARSRGVPVRGITLFIFGGAFPRSKASLHELRRARRGSRRSGPPPQACFWRACFME